MEKPTLPPNDHDASSSTAVPNGNRSMSRRSLVRASIVTGAIVAPVGAFVALNGQRMSAAPRLTSSTAFADAAQKTHVEAGRQSLGSLSGAGAQFVEIQNDENGHVTFLQQALGSNARPKPTFKGLDAPDIQTFAKDSMTFENLGVGAYLMAAPAISSKDYLKAAGSILTIEARHAGFIDALLGDPLSANGAFDKPISQSDIVTAVTPFVASLNGGPDPSKTLSSDTDILNFALLLEFLEAEFYNTNVPKFYGTAGQG
ncbi:MAG TPA: ferritin-like domain-containing protein [Ktedonobacterales bacterium]|nr:ferritin-like domain-containing protein [Ktedonobacterales bacterium]